VTDLQIARLLDKYRTLAELRRARERGESPPEKKVFRTLAEEFPGALNDLDMLPLEEIDRRAAALASASAGGPVLPWMEWLCAYHALMRAALRVKRRLARTRDVAGDRAIALAEEATSIAGIPLDADFVRAVARPPLGRITPLVLARLSELFGAEPDAIADELFPRRRALRGVRAPVRR
jgi:hypothetical protein